MPRPDAGKKKARRLRATGFFKITPPLPCAADPLNMLGATCGTRRMAFDFQLRPVGCHRSFVPRFVIFTVQGFCGESRTGQGKICFLLLLPKNNCDVARHSAVAVPLHRLDRRLPQVKFRKDFSLLERICLREQRWLVQRPCSKRETVIRWRTKFRCRK